MRVLTPRELRRRANVNDLEEMIVREELSMLVVDQLSLMDDISSLYSQIPKRERYGNITADLFSLSVKYSIPIILMVQSNRGGATGGNAPELDNIAESDAVAQNATRVISMRKENNLLTLKIIKNRYGVSDISFKYDVDYSINKFNAVNDEIFNPIVKTNKSFGFSHNTNRFDIKGRNFKGPF